MIGLREHEGQISRELQQHFFVCESHELYVMGTVGDRRQGSVSHLLRVVLQTHSCTEFVNALHSSNEVHCSQFTVWLDRNPITAVLHTMFAQVKTMTQSLDRSLMYDLDQHHSRWQD